MLYDAGVYYMLVLSCRHHHRHHWRLSTIDDDDDNLFIRNINLSMIMMVIIILIIDLILLLCRVWSDFSKVDVFSRIFPIKCQPFSNVHRPDDDNNVVILLVSIEFICGQCIFLSGWLIDWFIFTWKLYQHPLLFDSQQQIIIDIILIIITLAACYLW